MSSEILLHKDIRCTWYKGEHYWADSHKAMGWTILNWWHFHNNHHDHYNIGLLLDRDCNQIQPMNSYFLQWKTYAICIWDISAQLCTQQFRTYLQAKIISHRNLFRRQPSHWFLKLISNYYRNLSTRSKNSAELNFSRFPIMRALKHEYNLSECAFFSSFVFEQWSAKVLS